MAVRSKKEQHLSLTKDEMRELAEREAMAAIITYFQDGGNGPEAKQGILTIAAIAKKEASENNKRQTDFVIGKYNAESKQRLLEEKKGK